MADETPGPKKLGTVKRVAKVPTAPAPAKATKKVKAAASAKAKKDGGAPRGVRGTVGVTTGLSINAFQNALMAKNNKAKLTDAQLADAMRKEFPNAIAYTEKHVSGIRSAFNNGAHGNEKPETPTLKYGEDGKPIVRGGGAKKEKAEKAPKVKAKVTAKKKG